MYGKWQWHQHRRTVLNINEQHTSVKTSQLSRVIKSDKELQRQRRRHNQLLQFVVLDSVLQGVSDAHG